MACGGGISEESFNQLLLDISEWYDHLPTGINMLQVLYRDHVMNNNALCSASKMIDLLAILCGSGDLSPTNLSILYDTINVTGQFGFKPKFQDQFPLFQNVREIAVSKFTWHRQKLLKLGMVLKSDDVGKLDIVYNMPKLMKYEDSWSLITDLEQKMKILEEEETMKGFTDNLNALELYLAVRALTVTEGVTVKVTVKPKRETKDQRTQSSDVVSSQNDVIIDQDIPTTSQQASGEACKPNSQEPECLVADNILPENPKQHKSVVEQQKSQHIEIYNSKPRKSEVEQVRQTSVPVEFTSKCKRDSSSHSEDQPNQSLNKKYALDIAIELEKFKKNLQIEDIREMTMKCKKLHTYYNRILVAVLAAGDGSLVFHLSVHDPSALMNLWEIHLSAELRNDLAEIIFPEKHQQLEFRDEWMTCIDELEYKTALNKLKEKVPCDSEFCIVSDDTEWENQLMEDLKQRRPYINGTIMKKWRLSKPETINDLIGRSRKLIIAFSPKALIDYSKYAAHSIVLEMLEAKTLCDANVIAVKISEDSVLPPEFDSFTVVNAWEEHFVDQVLQNLDEYGNQIPLCQGVARSSSSGGGSRSSGGGSSSYSSSSGASGTYVDNSYNRGLGRVGMEHGSMPVSRDGAYGSDSTNTYADNAYNRIIGRVGMKLGSMSISKGSKTSKSSDGKKAEKLEPKVYANNAKNRQLGRDGKPFGSMPLSSKKTETGYLQNAYEHFVNKPDDEEFYLSYPLPQDLDSSLEPRLTEMINRMELLRNHDWAPTRKPFEWYDGPVIQFSDLDIGKTIGHGRFGDVHHAKLKGKVVAVKKLRVQRVSHKRLSQFEEEVRVFCKLQHKNIITFYGACITTPNVCIVMEFMDGSLFDKLHVEQHQFGDKDQKFIAMEIADGLVYLHSQNVAHCDMKPTNVLINVGDDVDKHQVKITDFGLSKMKDYADTSRSTSADDLVKEVGTQRYSAPEDLRGECLDTKGMMMADVYSFGLVMFEIFSGEEAFDEYNAHLLKRNVGYGDHKPDVAGLGLPHTLHALMLECWHRDPILRPTAKQCFSSLKKTD